MKRVIVIGSGGAGKSTFARRLGEKTKLPVIHLDAEYWRAGWVETPSELWGETVARLVTGDEWIIDGNYGGTMAVRIQACDTAVFLDFHRTVCLARVIRRWIRFHGRHRPDMPPGCNERLSLDFLRWIWEFPEAERPRILERLRHLRGDQQAIILRSQAGVEAFLARDVRASSN